MVIYHLRSADMTAIDNMITVIYSEVTRLSKGTVIILTLLRDDMFINMFALPAR